MRLRLDEVREDPEVQLRQALDPERIAAMIDFEEQGGHLPPISVVGDDNLLGDGHHRLEMARRSGRVDIEANRFPGGKAEAVALAIQMNDIATAMPLNRVERNAGIKVLLREGWTQAHVAQVTGVDHQTIANIRNALAQRGLLPKARASDRPKGGPEEKAVAVLPHEVEKELGDTVLARIASLPVDQQPEFAAAIAEVHLPEARVREAIKLVKGEGLSPVEAVAEVTPNGAHRPTSVAAVFTTANRRIRRFVEEPMEIEGKARDFWQVLDVLVAHPDASPIAAREMAELLADLAVKADHYASALRSEKVTA